MAKSLREERDRQIGKGHPVMKTYGELKRPFRMFHYIQFVGGKYRVMVDQKAAGNYVYLLDALRVADLINLYTERDESKLNFQFTLWVNAHHFVITEFNLRGGKNTLLF